MTYPRLPEDLDLRRRLTSSQIEEIRQRYADAQPFAARSEVGRAQRLEQPLPLSEHAFCTQMAEEFEVSHHTIYYWVKDEYRDWKREVNAKAHSKEVNPIDYCEHRAANVRNRAERMKRYRPQVLWHNACARRRYRAPRA